MKQGKHFKRTAFNLSAKSMLSTLLLLIAMLLPQGAWAVDFISEIKVSVENGNSGSNAKRRLSDDGYQIVNVGGAADLNGGAGGSTDYVYIGYKTSTNAADAITGLLIVESSSDPKFDAHAFDNITNANVIYNGKNYYRCDNYKVNDDGRLDCDLNRHNSKGADIVLFYTKDGNTSNGGTPLTSITVVGNTTETGVTYTRHWQYGTAQNGTGNTDVYGNTNQGNGTAHYITYTTHTHAYTAAFNWATNGKSCTATTNCAGCGDTHSNLACTVTDAPKSGAAATCTVMGWTTYTAKVTSNGKDFSATKDVQDIAALGHGSAGYTESYSWTGNAYNNASQDTKACTFTLTCKKCSTKVVNGASLTCTKTAHVDASCTATGSTTYQATGSYTAANSAYNYSATKTNVYTVAALGHGSTGYTDSYSWTGNAYNDASQDTKACTFTLTCKKCSTKVVNGASLTCTKTAHVDALCTATGSTTYQATGSYTAANSAYNYSATKTNVYTIAALGHSYGAGAWSWEDDGHTATCTRTCSHDANHTSSVSVTLGNGITSELTEAATCSKKGSHTYTATTTVENVEYSDSKEVADIDIDPLNHNYGAGVWSWNNDGHSATCTRTCSYDANHTSSASVTLGNGIESVKLSDPTCGVQGTTRYTAMTTVEGAQYSDTKDIDDIAATGLHTFDDETDPHHTLCTVCAHSFFRYTSSTEDVVNPNNANTLMGAGSKKLDFTNTYVDGQGVMEFKGTLKTIGLKAFYNCYLFTGNLTIPNSVTSIGTSAFYGCSGFTGNLTIPNSVTSIGTAAFENCSGLKGNLTIPNSVTSIGASAFNSCSGFTGNLTIPNSVTSIGGYAFYGCYSFNGNLTIPNSVTSIERCAFSGCWGLKGNLTIPNSVTSIEKSAFEGCSGFTGNLTIPNSVTSIGDYAFSGCKGLTGIEFQSVPQIGSSTFNQVNCSKTVVLSDNSNVYTGSNPYFPTVASVTAPCTLDLTGSVVENHAKLTRTHSYTNNTLTASPIEDGLYAYACDNGCGTHTDDHIIKDFYGAGNHLELTKDGEGNYSTSEDIIINDPASFYSSVDFSSPVDFTAARVTFNRYFINDGGMWSFIVPFDIPAGQAAELGKFYQYSKHEEGKVYFDDITKIDNADGIVRANTAYFFEPATDFTSITVDDAEIKATTSMADATNPSEPGLYGTYSQIDIPVGAYGYAMHWGESTFVKAGTGNLLRSFRAYLWLGSGASMAKALAFFGDYDDITGINNIETDTDLDMSKPIYTLSGQRIMTPKKGEIYIQNGKKVIKK